MSQIKDKSDDFGLNSWVAVTLFTEMAYLNKELFKEQRSKDSRVLFCLLVTQAFRCIYMACAAEVEIPKFGELSGLYSHRLGNVLGP